MRGGVFSATEDAAWDALFRVRRAAHEIDVMPDGERAERAADLLAESGIRATVVNPRFASGVDGETLDALAATHELFVTLENGSVAGGFGEHVASRLAARGAKTLVRGLPKEFYDKVPFDELLRRNRLTPEQIAEDALAALGK